MPKTSGPSILGWVTKSWRNAFSVSRYGSLLVLTIVTNLGMAGLQVFTGVLAARLMGPVGRGELAAIQTWPNMLAVLAALGLEESLAFFSAREPKESGQQLMTVLGVTLISCLPFGLLGYWLLPVLLQAQGDMVIRAAQQYLWFLPVNLLVGLPFFVLRGRNDLVVWNMLRPLPVLAWLAVLTLATVGHISNPIWVSQWYLVFLLLVSIIVGFAVKLRIPGSFWPSTKLVKPMLGYGLPLVLSTVPSTLNLRLDQMLMAGILGPKLLGLYVVGVAWSSAGAPVLGALSATILPRVAGTRSVDDQRRRLTQTIRLGTLLSLLVTSLVALLAPIAIPVLFGADYIESVPSAIILAVASGVLALVQLLESGAVGLGYPRLPLIAELVGLVSTLVLLWLLLPSYQLIGAAVASLLSYTLVLLLLVYLLKRYSGVSVKDMFILSRKDIQMVSSRVRSFNRNNF